MFSLQSARKSHFQWNLWLHSRERHLLSPVWFYKEQINSQTASVDQKCQVDTVYLDIRKAFDSVAHDRLLQKLWTSGLTGNLIVVFFAEPTYPIVVNASSSMANHLCGYLCPQVCHRVVSLPPCSLSSTSTTFLLYLSPPKYCFMLMIPSSAEKSSHLTMLLYFRKTLTT